MVVVIAAMNNGHTQRKKSSNVERTTRWCHRSWSATKLQTMLLHMITVETSLMMVVVVVAVVMVIGR